MKLSKDTHQNNLTPHARKQTKAAKRAYSKESAIMNAINENTKQLKELADEIKELKKCISDK
jgi:predicted choloylglycine hydrolase